MGWAIWVIETTLAFAAAYVASLRIYPKASTALRAITTFPLAHALILSCILLCGFGSRLDRVHLTVVSTIVFLMALILSGRGLSKDRIVAAIHHDLRAPARAIKDAWTYHQLVILAAIPGCFALARTFASVWLFKSWSWDSIWYHVPLISYTIQKKSLAFIDSHILQMSFPRNIELFGVWNCIFSLDNRLDDTAQLGFLIWGAFLLIAWVRDLGVSRPIALGVSAAWFALPPIFLVAPTANIDIATAVLLATTVFFLARPAAAVNRWMVALNMGIYVGAKYHGLFHLLLLSPLLIHRVFQEFKQRPAGLKWYGNVALSIIAFLLLSSYFYIQNAFVTGNPFWPLPFRIPLVNLEIRGSTAFDLFPNEVALLYARSQFFFQEPGSFLRMISSWFNDHPDYIPDVKAGGFGPLFRWILVPSMIIAWLGLLWSDRRLLPVLFLFAISIVVPMAWWPRFIIGAAMASLICYAQVSEKVPRRWLGSIVGLFFAFVTWQGCWTAMKGAARFSPMPKFLEAAWNASPVERSSLQIDVNLWPTEWNLQKEGEFQPGDAITYDESGYFLSELWCHDYRNPVFFVSSRQPPRDFLTKVHELRARWVGLDRNSAAAAAIQAIGGQFLFTAPATGLSLYRLGPRR